MQEEIYGLECSVYPDNIHIKDSYTVNDKKMMANILSIIKRKHSECLVFEQRNWSNLLSEWKAHNRLYKWGYKPEQTGSVDLDVYEPWWRRFLYSILGV